jgi:hypothetical protein
MTDKCRLAFECKLYQSCLYPVGSPSVQASYVYYDMQRSFSRTSEHVKQRIDKSALRSMRYNDVISLVVPESPERLHDVEFNLLFYLVQGVIARDVNYINSRFFREMLEKEISVRSPAFIY